MILWREEGAATRRDEKQDCTTRRENGTASRGCCNSNSSGNSGHPPAMRAVMRLCNYVIRGWSDCQYVRVNVIIKESITYSAALRYSELRPSLHSPSWSLTRARDCRPRNSPRRRSVYPESQNSTTSARRKVFRDWMQLNCNATSTRREMVRNEKGALWASRFEKLDEYWSRRIWMYLRGNTSHILAYETPVLFYMYMHRLQLAFDRALIDMIRKKGYNLPCASNNFSMLCLKKWKDSVSEAGFDYRSQNFIIQI